MWWWGGGGGWGDVVKIVSIKVNHLIDNIVNVDLSGIIFNNAYSLSLIWMISLLIIICCIIFGGSIFLFLIVPFVVEIKAIIILIRINPIISLLICRIVIVHIGFNGFIVLVAVRRINGLIVLVAVRWFDLIYFTISKLMVSLLVQFFFMM